MNYNVQFKMLCKPIKPFNKMVKFDIKHSKTSMSTIMTTNMLTLEQSMAVRPEGKNNLAENTHAGVANPLVNTGVASSACKVKVGL